MRALDPRLLRRTKSARPLLTLDTLLGAGAALAVLLQASMLALIVARAFNGVPLDRLWPYFGLLLSAFLGRGACAWAMEIAGRRAAWSVLSELRLALVEKRLSAQPTAVDGTDGAEVAAASVQGIEALEGYFARYLPQVVLAVVVPLVVLAWVSIVDLESALIMLLTLPLVPVFMVLIGRYTRRRTEARWLALRRLSTHFLDVVRGLPTLRAFGRADDQLTTVAKISERYRAATMETLRVTFLSGSVLELAATLGVAFVAVTAGVRLADGSLQLQAGLTVLVLAPELYLPFRRLGAEYHASADGLAVADRMFGLLDAPASACPGGARLAPSPAQVPVRLEQVSFSYPSRSVPVLDRLDLELAPGETVALVGESGAGKSTVAGLLVGLLEPTSGRISVGGVDLGWCQPEAWRRFVGWVPQQPTMFRGSVAENIRLGDPTAPDLHVRAFLRDAPLIILDEPTADLDPRNVAGVSSAVRRLQEGRTMLLIAHRPELVGHADRVVRLIDGVAAREQDRRAA